MFFIHVLGISDMIDVDRNGSLLPEVPQSTPVHTMVVSQRFQPSTVLLACTIFYIIEFNAWAFVFLLSVATNPSVRCPDIFQKIIFSARFHIFSKAFSYSFLGSQKKKQKREVRKL